ncbi:hypothetical protein GCM10023091_28770 [Ravibacter arvi]|uniref:Secretion system C-terminal sorting domain-containing protein n=1 Tax=Ravibacter arvi TaxID=2051041 RepID=A0ABP8M124_9BACT
MKIVYLTKQAISVYLCLTLTLCAIFASGQAPAPFECSHLAYQVSSNAGSNSTLYSYDVASGTRTLLHTLPLNVNAIGYNTTDNFMYGIAVTTKNLVKIGSNGSIETHVIPNLPTADYNVGDFIGDGYYFVYGGGTPRYYVIDVNPSRSTYLQLVDPTAAFVLDNSPYGNTFNGSPGLSLSDLAYNPLTGLLYGVIDPQGALAYRRVTVNPLTRAVSFSAAAILGGGIQSETQAFGSAFIDANQNHFYVFGNQQGRFYRVNLADNTAVTISSSAPAENNDGASCPNAFLVTPTPFECSALAYQVTYSGGAYSNLYSYNVATGTRTLISELTVSANAIGYNTLDNYLWGVIASTNQVVKIGANGGTEIYNIPNLPVPSMGYNVGDFIGDGYWFVYDRTATRYYVIDVNPARSTYLQLVDPTASFALDTAPYGNAFTGDLAGSILNLSDVAYNPATGLLYSMMDPSTTGGNAFKSVTINPVTTQVTLSAGGVSGASIQTEGTAYGSVFIDQAPGIFYVFANQLGRFYKIDINTNTASLVSTSLSAANNDGASCPNAFLTASISGNIFHDPDGGNVNNSTGAPNTVPSGLFANLVNSAGNVVAVVPVNSAGIYGFTGTPSGTYTVVLSTTSGVVNEPAPTPVLPTGWVNTGEFNGAPNTGNTGPVDGISPPFTYTAGSELANINFGIQEPPVAEVKSFNLPATPAVNDIISLSAGGDSNTGNTPGNLTGNDPDGGVLNSTTAPYGVTINTIPLAGTLIYDGTPITTANYYIPNYDPTKLEFQFTGSGYSNVSFTYSVHDAAGAQSTPVSYAIAWEGSLPVNLVSFTGRKGDNSSVALTWITSSETNSEGFEIEHSVNGKNWITIGRLASKGESRELSRYTFTHSDPSNGKNMYRLKMIDFDRTFAYSNIIRLDYRLAAEVSVYPNPAIDAVKIKIEGVLNSTDIRNVDIYDLNGRAVYSASKPTSGEIDVTHLNAGTYIIAIQHKNGTRYNTRVIIKK